MKPEGIYQELLDQLQDGVYFVDSVRRITHWNAAAERITGYAADEVVGRLCHENILRHVDTAGRELCTDGCPLHRTMLDGAGRSVAKVFLHHKEGHRVPIQVHTLPVFGQDDQVEGAVEIFSEKGTPGVDLQRRITDLHRRLLLDKLTQLPNREHAERNIRTRLYDLRNGGSGFGVAFADIDHFKVINDTYGHNVGDHALRITASTLSNNIRPGDVFARWGGEEFVGLFDGVDVAGLGIVSEKLVMLVRNSPLVWQEESIRFTISIGATLARPEDDLEGLIQRADALMYQSKSAGRDRFTIG
jgi:diguanylate cyclase (GGDEF)-like protein/PAS domain S-box-containing protein